MECQESLYRFALYYIPDDRCQLINMMRSGVEYNDTEKYLEAATSATTCSFTFLAMI